MRFTFGLVGLCLSNLIAASIIKDLECLVVDVVQVVDVLLLCPTATQFCSSYLGICTQSVTVTSTTTASTTLSTTIVTGSTTVYPETVTVTNTGTVSITSCPASVSTAPQKRGLVERGGGSQTSCGCSTVYPTPAGCENFGASLISQGCSCLHIPTPTTTVTATATVTNTVTSDIDVITTISATSTIESSITVTTTGCTIPTSCSNVGLQWAYYENPDTLSNDQTACNYSSFDPTPLKTATVLDQGTTTEIDIHGDGSALTLYGKSEPYPTFFAVNHRGYLIAPSSGTYTFSATGADEIIIFWIGPDAYSGWTRDNADGVDAINDCGRTVPFSFSIDLVGGVYYPIRVVYADAQGFVTSGTVALTAPDGTILLGGGTGPSPWIVQFSCDGTSAPSYPPFGQET